MSHNEIAVGVGDFGAFSLAHLVNTLDEVSRRVDTLTSEPEFIYPWYQQSQGADVPNILFVDETTRLQAPKITDKKSEEGENGALGAGSGGDDSLKTSSMYPEVHPYQIWLKDGMTSEPPQDLNMNKTCSRICDMLDDQRNLLMTRMSAERRILSVNSELLEDDLRQLMEKQDFLSGIVLCLDTPRVASPGMHTYIDDNLVIPSPLPYLIEECSSTPLAVVAGWGLESKHVGNAIMASRLTLQSLGVLVDHTIEFTKGKNSKLVVPCFQSPLIPYLNIAATSPTQSANGSSIGDTAQDELDGCTVEKHADALDLDTNYDKSFVASILMNALCRDTAAGRPTVNWSRLTTSFCPLISASLQLSACSMTNAVRASSCVGQLPMEQGQKRIVYEYDASSLAYNAGATTCAPITGLSYCVSVGSVERCPPKLKKKEEGMKIDIAPPVPKILYETRQHFRPYESTGSKGIVREYVDPLPMSWSSTLRTASHDAIAYQALLCSAVNPNQGFGCIASSEYTQGTEFIAPTSVKFLQEIVTKGSTVVDRSDRSDCALLLNRLLDLQDDCGWVASPLAHDFDGF